MKSWWVYANFWQHLHKVASYEHINCILFCFGWVLYLFSFFLGAQWHTSCCNNISFRFLLLTFFSSDALGKSWPSVVCMDASKFIIVKASDKLIYCACYNAERMLIKGNDNNVYFKETTTGLYTCGHKHVSPVSLFLALTLGPLTADFSFQSKGRSCWNVNQVFPLTQTTTCLQKTPHQPSVGCDVVPVS